MADLTREELRAAWEGEQGHAGKDRIKFVQVHADAIDEHTDIDEPVPPSRDAATADWLDRYKGTVTRQLNDAADGADPHDEEESDG